MKHKTTENGASAPDERAVSGGSRGRRTLRRKWWVIVAVLVVAAAGFLAWGIFDSSLWNKKQVQFDTSEEHRQVTELEKRTIPTTDKEKASYYMQLGAAYENLADYSRSQKKYDQERESYSKALEAMLTADEHIKDRSVATGQTANVAIARYYDRLGNKSKAREYYQREIDRAKNDPSAAENATVIEYIEKLKREV